VAAQLFGAAAHLHARYGAIAEQEIPEFQPEIAAELRATLGDTAYIEAFATGGATPIAEIVALAMSLSERAPVPRE
jgi:hypothetical protein